MIALSTLSKDVYPKAHHYLFGMGPGTMYHWADPSNLSSTLLLQLAKFGQMMGPWDLQSLLIPGQLPILKLVRGNGDELNGALLTATDDSFVLNFRVFMSYHQGKMPESAFRDNVVVCGLVLWFLRNIKGVPHNKALEVVFKFKAAAFGKKNLGIDPNQLVGEEYGDLPVPDPDLGVASSQPKPIVTTTAKGPIRAFFAHRKEVRAERLEARAKRKAARAAS